MYRYLWDGTVVAYGQNPYRLSPQPVLYTSQQLAVIRELRSLVSLRTIVLCCDEMLARIHHGTLTTVYPPVAQAVFGCAARITPGSATLYGRLLIMKGVLTLFDLATVLLVLAILRRVGGHAAWAILCAWSPLVLKEFANSGHLDSVAVCLTTGAVLCQLSSLSNGRFTRKSVWFILSALLLEFGVGAKLYPIILIPVLALLLARKTTWKKGMVFTTVAVLVGTLSVWPMLATSPAILSPSAINPPEVVSVSGETVVANSGLVALVTGSESTTLCLLSLSRIFGRNRRRGG